MVLFAHIAGIPVEETALSMAPVAATIAGVAGAKLNGMRQQRLDRRRRPARCEPTEPEGKRET